MEKTKVSVEQYRAFHRDGFLVVRGLVGAEEIAELRQHTEDLMQGRLPEQSIEMKDREIGNDAGTTTQELAAPPAHLSPTEKAQYFLRIHMLHRKLALHERYLLHPRVLDVLEILIGPDLLALQTMLFLKPPGKPGQGWHQDSYYIPTYPDSLCGAWIAVDDCDASNGAMWFAQGSQVEPIYPPAEGYGFGDRQVEGIGSVAGVSNPDDNANELSPVAARYPQVLAAAKAGDVVFFGGHVLHRSKQNTTSDRFRRAFVSHYCNARAFTPWSGGETLEQANHCHILARGDSHLPFAQPRFGTACAALLAPEERRKEGIALRVVGSAGSGDMGIV